MVQSRPSAMAKILIVDDDPDIRRLLAIRLKGVGH
jgi:CheY-like chemotaxis protein